MLKILEWKQRNTDFILATEISGVTLVKFQFNRIINVSFQGYTHGLGFTAFIIVFGSSFLFGYNIGVLNQVKVVSIMNILCTYAQNWREWKCAYLLLCKIKLSLESVRRVFSVIT